MAPMPKVTRLKSRGAQTDHGVESVLGAMNAELNRLNLSVVYHPLALRLGLLSN